MEYDQQTIIIKGNKDVIKEHPNKNKQIPKQENIQLVISDKQVDVLMNNACKPCMTIEKGSDLASKHQITAASA